MNYKLVVLILLLVKGVWSQNQTDELSPILPSDSLPFEISIQIADFQLPSDLLNSVGLQSFALGTYGGKWLFFAGRTSGVHGFSNTPDNFPVNGQNTVVYVVDPKKGMVTTRSLIDSSSNLTQSQIDSLSVTSPQYYQVDNTLYFVGGYGLDTATGTFTTKSTLTAIDVPGLMKWVEGKSSSAAKHIRQTSHPLLQVTGGYMSQATPHSPFLLIFGQNFDGDYTVTSNGNYTQQIRPFRIIDNGSSLYIKPEKQFSQNPNYRRRDLNVSPIIQKVGNAYLPSYIVYSGVFTVDTGIWTVPVFINPDGTSSMPDPSNPNTFKQGMNNYDCAHAELYSKKTNKMYTLLYGGLSYLSVSGGMFIPDVEIPFINSVTTIELDSNGNFSQYLMNNQYPEIPSDFINFGNPLLFGSEARFLHADILPQFPNGVFSLDELGSEPVLLGYIVGGIQSTVPNTSTQADSSASPYIFSVYLHRQ